MSQDKKKVLLISFSFSSQTNNLTQALVNGLEEYNIDVVRERITPVDQLHFPIGSIGGTVWMMVETFFRKRIAIEPLSEHCFDHFDLILLAGPTWSYNPSGPVLSLFDRDGEKLFKGKLILPLISCRGYWRMHWWGLKGFLRKCGARVVNLIVFSHPNPEPWRTIGVFLKLAGRVPERKSWIARKYHKYGHTREQTEEAKRFGTMIGKCLDQGETGIQHLEFNTQIITQSSYDNRPGMYTNPHFNWR